MKDEDIQKIVDMNYRVLLLLGFASSIVGSYRRLESYHDDEEKCKWFFDSVQAVVYENKPLPPMP